MPKIIQIAIERGEDLDGTTVTALWALSNDGRIFVQVRGKWEQQDGPAL
jgi:hypothetical protein